MAVLFTAILIRRVILEFYAEIYIRLKQEILRLRKWGIIKSRVVQKLRNAFNHNTKMGGAQGAFVRE